MYILGLSGYMGVGKTYVANQLSQHFKVASFGTGVRTLLAKLFNCDLDYVYNKAAMLSGPCTLCADMLEEPLSDFEAVDKINADLQSQHVTMSIGCWLQHLGQLFRQHDKDYWIRLLANKLSEDENYIIDDVRYVNEADYIRKYGYVFRLFGTETGKYCFGRNRDHISENSLENYPHFEALNWSNLIFHLIMSSYLPKKTDPSK